ncbi:MAG: ATP-binding protein, partial [Caulobacteraceae bacterium]|nr:ATP-binding protein [Caulobacteraceae bacterium]
MLTAKQSREIEAKLALHQDTLKKLPEDQAAAFHARMKWLMKAHKYQIPPKGDWFTIWMLVAGRGSGKTRTAAEDIWYYAWTHPNHRVLISGPTSADIRDTMIEGESGLLA